MKKAMITGITGQDGSYLTELLLKKDYEVHGVVRRSSSLNTSRLDHLLLDSQIKGTRLFLHHGDMSDSASLVQLIREIRPDEIYNLAAQSHVRVSFDEPEYTCEITGLGTVRILQAMRETELNARFYQAGSSEMFGKTDEISQSEKTPFHPRSPYATAKVFAHWSTVNYRESYGIFACNGILFNHESPRRGETFVTRKITRAIAEIEAGARQKLQLGNLSSKRDWGFAEEYVESMWMMLQQDEPDDYVIATGETHSVEEFLQEAFSYAGLEWQKYVEIDSKYYRSSEVDALCGNPQKAKGRLGWEAQTRFHSLVRLMVDADREQVASKKQSLETNAQ